MTEHTSEQKKRYSRQSLIERVGAGGGYDEWFDLRVSPTVGGVLDLSESSGQGDASRVATLLHSLIVDWSLTDEAGNKLPITVDNVRALPVDMTMPMFERVNKLSESFLALGSLLTSKSESTPS